MHAMYKEGSKSYPITSNWNNFVQAHQLKPRDKIVISYDPKLSSGPAQSIIPSINCAVVQHDP